MFVLVWRPIGCVAFNPSDQPGHDDQREFVDSARDHVDATDHGNGGPKWTPNVSGDTSGTLPNMSEEKMFSEKFERTAATTGQGSRARTLSSLLRSFSPNNSYDERDSNGEIMRTKGMVIRSTCFSCATLLG